MLQDTDLLAILAREWNRIEGRAKEVENFRGEAVVAAINEMRYAGRRIVDYYVCKQENLHEEAYEHLRVAKAYLTNADHDLTDSVIFFVHQRISATEDRYGASRIEELCHLYAELKQKIRDAHSITQGSRADRKNRIGEYDRLAREYIPKLIELHDELIKIPELALGIDIGFLEKNVALVAKLAFASSMASIISLLVGLWSVWLSYHPPLPSTATSVNVSPAANTLSTGAKPSDQLKVPR